MPRPLILGKTCVARALVISAIVVATLTSLGDPAVALPDSADQWRHAAETDLAAMHDLLDENSPARYVERDSALFRDWLDSGLADARRHLPEVHDAASYYYLLRRYAGGFRDMHIVVWPSPDARGFKPVTTRWPGIATGWTDGAYVVRAIDPDGAATLPPVGAKLLDCDGKPAEALARERLDRFEANLDLTGERVRSAYALLWDLGNPYVTPLAACRFAGPAGIQSVPLSYRPLDPALLRRVVVATRGRAAKFGVERLGPKIWRIGLPGQTRDYDWQRLYDTIDANREAIRRADRLIIDVRGNDGGLEDFDLDLAVRLWGEPMVDYYFPERGPFVYRISKARRDRYAASLADIDRFVKPEVARAARAMLAATDAALAQGEHLLVRPGRPVPAKPKVKPADPVKAEVLILTDFACGSACLDLLDLYLAFPHVTQVGWETNADTIFMGRTDVDLPSGLSKFGWGEQGWIERPRGSNVSDKPAVTYTGDPADEDALTAWLTTLPVPAGR